MEENERYELKIYAGCESYSITDTKEKQQITLNNVINLLNKQDKRIKELEKQLKDTEESYNNTMRYLNKTRSELLNLHKKI